MSEERIVRVFVLGENSEGAPEFFIANISCTEPARNEGEHYELAEEQARLAGYVPKVSFDECDPAYRLMGPSMYVLASKRGFLGPGSSWVDSLSLAACFASADALEGFDGQVVEIESSQFNLDNVPKISDVLSAAEDLMDRAKKYAFSIDGREAELLYEELSIGTYEGCYDRIPALDAYFSEIVRSVNERTSSREAVPRG